MAPLPPLMGISPARAEPVEQSSGGAVREGLAWAVCALVVALGLPPFMRMPLWADVTLYDLAARNLLHGGVHYRDVFDSNLPGMVWAHVLIRWAGGFGPGWIRAVDLAVWAGTAWLLQALVPAPRAARVGLVAAWGACYLGSSEWCHVQRDVWMLAPALAALHLRRAGWAVAEGALWGIAFWIKPFVLLPALAVEWAWRAPGLGARVAGGAAVVAGGIAWVICAGSGPWLVDVLTVWDAGYFDRDVGPALRTVPLLVRLFPWGLVHLVALPAALDALRRPGTESGAAGRIETRGVAALYLGWVAQALYLQRAHDYVIMPLHALGLAVAVGRLAQRPARGGWLFAAGLAALATGWSPLVAPVRLTAWWDCVHGPSTPELADRMALKHGPDATCWTDLAAVGRHLTAARDGEVLCLGNGTHPLYLILGVRPASRFLHLGTVLSAFPHRRATVLAELKACRPRWLVVDTEADPAGSRNVEAWPWNQPLEHVCGRYEVRRAERMDVDEIR